MFVPTTTVTVLTESETEDEFGDPVDSYKAVRKGVKAHIWEDAKTAFNPSDSRVQTVRTLKGLVADSKPLKKNDRLRDENTDAIYMITHVRLMSSLFSSAPQQVEMSLVT